MTYKKPRKFGSAKGLIKMADDFDAPLEEFYSEKPDPKGVSKVTGNRSDATNDDMTSSETILASSRSWSDIPDDEFNQLLKDVYEQRRIQNIEAEKSKPKSNGPTMAEMLERLQVINEEEPIELDIPPRVNRPVDLSFVLEEDEYGSAIDEGEQSMSSAEITLSLAGAWSDMPNEEFDDFLNEVYARRQGRHLRTEESAPNSLTMAEMLERLRGDKADWLIFGEAALRAGNFRSLDQIILQALDAWFKQLPSNLRWHIAIDLYTSEEISSGKAAEIAGLNYFVFLDELRAHGIKFVGAELVGGEIGEREEALLDELTSL